MTASLKPWPKRKGFRLLGSTCAGTASRDALLGWFKPVLLCPFRIMEVWRLFGDLFIERHTRDPEYWDEMFFILAWTIHDNISAFAGGIQRDVITRVYEKSSSIGEVDSKRLVRVFVLENLTRSTLGAGSNPLPPTSGYYLLVTRGLLGERLITQLEMTTSAVFYVIKGYEKDLHAPVVCGGATRIAGNR